MSFRSDSSNLEKCPNLSAVIITLNEEAAIAGCLASLDWCDEVVVVDSGSTDRTSEVVAAKGGRLVTQPWLGFGPRKILR